MCVTSSDNEHAQGRIPHALGGGRGYVILTSAINSWMSTSRNGSATFRHFASRHSYEGREKHSVLIHHQTTLKLDCNCQLTRNILSSHFNTLQVPSSVNTLQVAKMPKEQV